MDLVAQDVLLLFADKRPRLIKFKTVHSNANHHAVVQFCAAATDAEREAGDRLAVAAGKRGDGALADAFAEGGDDFNLLFAGEVIQAGSIRRVGTACATLE